MKHLFIINPAAGSYNRTDECSAIIHKVCRARKVDYTTLVSTAPGETIRISRKAAQIAAQNGEDIRIYACGGDGTLNEVANGVAGYPNAAITVLSSGSGNDFVKIFDEPRAFFDLNRLMDAEETTFDLIRCNDDLALNICSVGLDARIAADVSKFKRKPLLHGHHAYLASTAVNLFRGLSEHYVVEINGETLDDEFTFVCVCNGRYYGGGFNPMPDADPCDGILDVLLVKKTERSKIAFLVNKYKNGHYKELAEYARYIRTDRVKITCDRPNAINLDGEQRTSRVVEMEVAKEKVRFFYPKGLTWKNH